MQYGSLMYGAPIQWTLRRVARSLRPALLTLTLVCRISPVRSGAARALYVLDASDLWSDLISEWSTQSLGKVAKPLARLWAKLNPKEVHLAACGPDTTQVLLKLLPGTYTLATLLALVS